MTPAPVVSYGPYEHAALDELKPVLHEEVTSLPDKYRIPVVLSYLEGKTNEEVAELLHWPVGTVKGRLSRGRALLRSRLMRRGVALGTAALLMHLSRSRGAAAEVSAELLRKTLELGIGPGSWPMAGEGLASSSPGLGTGEAPPVRQAAQHLRKRSLRRPRRGRLITTAVLLAAFSAAILVRGYVSAAAFGGNFTGLRSALSGIMPSFRSAPAAAPCHAGSIR
jgi:hypothetical protein